MNLIFVLGTAGSGKSTFTAKFTRFLEYQREDVMAVNLDPGSLILPYAANVDVREYIKVEEIMEEYGLGPNGGLMLAHDMMAGIVEDLSNDIEDFTPDICLIDTPGQMELFAFREIGAQIAQNLTDAEKGVIYIFDGMQCRDPLNYVMNMFLATAINTKFFLPQYHLISKIDALDEMQLEEMVSWSEDAFALEEAVDARLTGLNRTMSQDMMEIINRIGLEFQPIPVSSVTNDGFSDLYAQLMMTFTDGGKFSP
ncbi:MAG: ATP/GTP-binding protein [Candidatus Bathyarchaeota archaeon]|nr:ATP/GTP-binding protein [Candidatus Bathyarchaeota archaeon]